MKNYNKILTSLDMNSLDDLLVDYTLKMASCFDTKIIYGAHVIPVLTIPNFIKLDPSNYFLPVAPAVEKIREQVFQEIRSKVGDRDLGIKVKIHEGRPFSKLMVMTKEVQPGLLIFGKKAKTEGSGITAKRVAHNTDADVLIVPEGASLDLKKILVPIDFSENSYRALEMTKQLLGRLNLPQIVDTIHLADTGVLSEYKIFKGDEKHATILKKQAYENYERFIRQYGLKNESINFNLETINNENIANVLLQYAQTHDYDMIVLGARGHSYFDNFVFGSVAETILDLTHKIPVLIIR